MEVMIDPSDYDLVRSLPYADMATISKGPDSVTFSFDDKDICGDFEIHLKSYGVQYTKEG